MHAVQSPRTELPPNSDRCSHRRTRARGETGVPAHSATSTAPSMCGRRRRYRSDRRRRSCRSGRLWRFRRRIVASAMPPGIATTVRIRWVVRTVRAVEPGGAPALNRIESFGWFRWKSTTLRSAIRRASKISSRQCCHPNALIGSGVSGVFDNVRLMAMLRRHPKCLSDADFKDPRNPARGSEWLRMRLRDAG